MKKTISFLVLLLFLFSLSGCGKDIVLSDNAKSIIKEYKLELSLEVDENSPFKARDLIIKNNGEKRYRGTILADFDEKGYEKQVTSMVRDTSYDWFSCDVGPGKTVYVYMSIYDEYQIEGEVLYLDMNTDPIGYVGKDKVEHWRY